MVTVPFEFTTKDLSHLGYPRYVMTEVYKAYYKHTKEGGLPIEFKYTYNWDTVDIDKWMEDTKWIDRKGNNEDK